MGVVEAEKGKNLSSHNLHLRLRVLEAVVLVSLVLNLGHWYLAGERDQNLQNQVSAVQQQNGNR